MDGPARSRLASRTFLQKGAVAPFTKAFRGVSAPNREPTKRILCHQDTHRIDRGAIGCRVNVSRRGIAKLS